MRRSVLAFGLVSALACGSETTEPASGIPGTWNLTTVNAVALPFTLPGSGSNLSVEMTSDQIVAYADGTWVGTTTYRRIEGGGTTTVTQFPGGTWRLTGTDFTLNYFGGSTARATLFGDVITFSAPGVVAVYERE